MLLRTTVEVRNTTQRTAGIYFMCVSLWTSTRNTTRPNSDAIYCRRMQLPQPLTSERGQPQTTGRRGEWRHESPKVAVEAVRMITEFECEKSPDVGCSLTSSLLMKSSCTSNNWQKCGPGKSFGLIRQMFARPCECRCEFINPSCIGGGIAQCCR